MPAAATSTETGPPDEAAFRTLVVGGEIVRLSSQGVTDVMGAAGHLLRPLWRRS